MTIDTMFTRAETKIRLLRQTVIPEDETQCWLWTGRSLAGEGCPTLAIKRRGGSWAKEDAGRLMYWITYGDFEPDLIVVHYACHNLLCINPSHLKLIDSKDQPVILGQQERMSHGDDHHYAKLNDDLVRKLRSGELSVKDVMAITGIRQSTAHCAKVGKTWKHVT